MNLSELRNAAQKTQIEANDLQLAKNAFVKRERELRVAPLQEAVERENRAVHTEANAQFDASIQSALERASNARTAYEHALIEHNAKHTGWHPVGTKLVEWESRWSKWHRTGVTAIVEVWNHDSEMPDNQRWGRPQIGELVLRILKKDGTPGKKVLTVSNMKWFKQNWLLEGEEPKEVA